MKLLEDAGHYVMLYARHNSELEQMSKIGKLCLPLTTIFSVNLCGFKGGNFNITKNLKHLKIIFDI